MKVGDVAVYSNHMKREGFVLCCGSGVYTHAIVGSVAPFMLVSDDGTMVWRVTVEPWKFTFLCQASEEIRAVVAQRVARELANA